MAATPSFSSRILKWFKRHGRKDLPWQKNCTPYRVWVSEIMLQQTQVATVIPYYQKFMKRFPNIKQLAEADVDDVMQYWAGLGYYARARNLHKAAQRVMNEFRGRFPKEIEQVMSLPGVGRSTAGAILSLSGKQRYPILDGNVKRVLARHGAIEGWSGNKKIMDQLWLLSDELTPDKQVAEYNQAMMDMGATLCTRTRPACERCPVAMDCQALTRGLVDQLPTPKKKKTLPQRKTRMLVIENDGSLLLEKRPPSGIWGGLWSLPECSVVTDVFTYCKSEIGFTVTESGSQECWFHTFSHYRLNVQARLLRAASNAAVIQDKSEYAWFNKNELDELALSAAVMKLMELKLLLD